MFHTAEVRWFYPGALPDDLLAWFSHGQSIPVEERTDQYLVFPGCESVGVKIRAGHFEIKALQGGTETVRFAENVTGRLNCWVKWSSRQLDVDRLQMNDLPGNRWIAVTKIRWQRLYKLDHGQVSESAANLVTHASGSVELTLLRVDMGMWWTLGLEVSGRPMQAREILQRVAESFFEQYPPLYRLDTTRSCAYPVWLASL